MSQLIKELSDIADEHGIKHSEMFMQYFKEFQDYEKLDKTCYGAISSFQSVHKDYCMHCIQDKALNKIRQYYKERKEKYEVNE